MSIELAALICFWSGAAALLYTYVGYPLLVATVSRLRPRPIRRSDWTPTVSVIITAYNEERDLAAKLENTLALAYDADKLEIIVASDCSTDRTDEIAKNFAARGVRLHRQTERLGKTAAQNAAVEQARGEIILFSDATTLYQPDVLRVMMPSFADSRVGCVAGRLVYVDPAASSVGQGARSYWGYETFIKRQESRAGSLIGASGCLYAVRRSAYVPMYPEACSDFLIATKMVEQGLRAVYEPAAVCTEETNRDADKELRMRVRVITQTFTDLWRHRAMMNPLRSGFYSVQLISHKVLRYFVPVLLLLILAASIVLAPRSLLFALIAIAQACFYAAAALAWLLERLNAPRSRLLALPQYFVLANLASLIAFYKFLRGERFARWEPIREPAAATDAGSATTTAEKNADDADEHIRENMQAAEQIPLLAPAATDGPEQYLRTDHLQADLGARTARGGAVTVASQGLKFFLMMAATAVLGRLLTPQDYGLVGMVVIVTGFVAMFKDLGLSAATIQKAEISREQINTLFWLNVALSVFVMLLTVALAPVVAWFYGEPRLTWITIVTAAGFIFGGLTVQHEALLRRQMRFFALSVTALVSLTAGMVVCIIMAWRGAGYWALVVNQLVMGLTNAVGIWIVCGWRPGRPGRYAEVRAMVAFGRNLTSFAVVNYFARNLDNLLIGRVWGAQQLGFYSKAYQLLLLPLDQINEPITSVAVPALSRLTDSPARYRQAYLRIVEKVAMLTMPLMAFMIATSDWIVLLVLGPRWVEVSRIFALLGIVGLVQPIANTTGWLFVSQNRTHHMFQWGLIGGSLFIVSFFVGLPWGAVGVAVSYSLTGLCVVTPLLFWFVGRTGPVRARDIYATIAPAACAALSALVALFAFRRWIKISKPLYGLALALCLACVTYLLILAALPAGRRALHDVRKLIAFLTNRERDATVKGAPDETVWNSGPIEAGGVAAERRRAGKVTGEAVL